VRSGWQCLLVCGAFALFLVLPLARTTSAQEQDSVRGAPAEPVDAADIRAQMKVAESLLGKTPDRGAIYYFLAASYAQLRETLPAIEQLQK
jgi:predicted secreted protein